MLHHQHPLPFPYTRTAKTILLLTPNFGGVTGTKGAIDKQNCTLYVPKGCVDAYRNHNGWKAFTNIEEYEFAGVDAVAPNPGLADRISTNAKGIALRGGKGERVTVYTVSGNCVFRSAVHGDLDIALPKGIYIVHADNNALKIVM